MNPVSKSPSAHLRMRSPSPKPVPSQQDSHKEESKQPKYQPPCLWSTSPTLRQSPTACLPQHSPSPSMNPTQYHPSLSSPRQSFPHPKTDLSQNLNNNNNRTYVADVPISSGSNTSVCRSNLSVTNGSGSLSPQKMLLTNGNPDSFWSGSHNRVPRPFSASEPSSRVQSPSPSPSPGSIGHLHSPPPQHNYSSPMANKPPHPRSGRVACVSSHNPLGLTLEIPKASSFSLTCPSPQILSPPPIGVSVNVWTNNVAAPQPRNPRHASSSSPLPPSSFVTPTLENANFPNSSSALFSLQSSRTSPPSLFCPDTHPTSHNSQKSLSSSPADIPPSPVHSEATGLRPSWPDSSRRSLGFSGSGRGSFDQQESCPTSPRSGWSSHSSSPSCLSPRAGLESPFSSSRPPPGKSSLCGQHFTSVPWPDVQELSNKYNATDSSDTSDSSMIITCSSSPYPTLSHTTQISSPTTSDSQTEWGDPKLEQGNCRTQLICAYVARSSQEQNPSCMRSPSITPYHHQDYQSQVTAQPQVQTGTATSPTPSIGSMFSPSSSPLPFAHSKQRHHKPSYATTINLQIAGSGKITSFSTAQVSLTQTLQGGTGAPGQGQEIRRVSMNGLSLLPSPVPQL